MAAFQQKFIPFLIKYWHFLLVAALVFFVTGFDLKSGYYLIWSALLTSGIIGFAYRFPALQIKRDISYAVFIYHMIIVNIFVDKQMIGEWMYAIMVIVLTIICAYISTLTIGEWSANKKSHYS